MRDMRVFRFWCQKVLPLVYDESLSYYEVLCKVVKYINDLIASDMEIIEDVEALQKDMEVVKEWIDNYDTAFIEQIVNDYIAKAIRAVWFGLSASGYFMAVIPETWSGIQFGTIQQGDLYGHLTLEYN